jgi:hypothetical protein
VTSKWWPIANCTEATETRHIDESPRRFPRHQHSSAHFPSSHPQCSHDLAISSTGAMLWPPQGSIGRHWRQRSLRQSRVGQVCWKFFFYEISFTSTAFMAALARLNDWSWNVHLKNTFYRAGSHWIWVYRTEFGNHCSNSSCNKHLYPVHGTPPIWILATDDSSWRWFSGSPRFLKDNFKYLRIFILSSSTLL